MSDISKKIHSIDPVEKDSFSEKIRRPAEVMKDPVPEFVTRPNSTFKELEPDASGRWIIWLGSLLVLLWIGGCIAYTYFRTHFSLADLTPVDLAGLTLIVLFPALLILFLCVTGYKLTKVSANANTLVQASKALLRADDVATKQATYLAQSIRSEMNALEDDIENMADRLKSVQTETLGFAKNIEGNVTKVSEKTSSIGENLTSQRDILDALEKSTQDRMEGLNSLIALRKGSLEKATENSVAALGNAGTKLEQLSESFETFTHNIENRIKLVSDTLNEGQKESTQTVLALGEQTEVLHEKVLAMSAENKALKNLFDEQIALMEDFSSTNSRAQNTLKETLAHSRDVAESLKREARSGTDFMERQRQEMNGTVSETKDSLDELRRRIEELKDRADRIEGKQFSHAETVELPLPATPQPTAKASSGRLQLRPLGQGNGEVADSGNESVKLQTEAVRQILDGTDTALPLEEELGIPSLLSPDLSLDPYKNENISPTSGPDDLIRPVNPSRSLFGRTKKTEKSGWRWRDMIGGFDSSEIAEESAMDIVATTPASDVQTPIQNFETWLKAIELDPDAIISDGTILDYSSALIEAPEQAQEILNNRLKDISDYLTAEAKNQADIAHSAKAYRDKFTQEINTQIMNKDAVRSRLSLSDGKAYILSRLI